MNKSEHRKCYVCGNDKGESYSILWHVDEVIPEGIPLPNSFNVVSCPECGYCFADTVATQDDYDIYYSMSNIYEGRSRKKTPVADAVIEKIIMQFFSKEMRILDLGCGDGTMLRKLKELSHDNIKGIEVSEKNVNDLKASGIEADVRGAYDIIPNDELNSYDALISNCVLEHLLRPDIAVNTICNYLKDDGSAFVTVPNMCRVEWGGGSIRQFISIMNILIIFR